MNQVNKPMSFLDLIQINIEASSLAKRGKFSYLSAAGALALAGRPHFEVVRFGEKPYLEILGGMVVAVDIPLPNGTMQRTYLPVLDENFNPLLVSNADSADIHNSLTRCIVKAIASVTGAGMSVFLGFDGEGEKAFKMLKCTPDTDLSKASPIVSGRGGIPYVEWGVGLSVSRITDPEFHWEVTNYNEKPYLEVLGGAFVEVVTTYKGRRQAVSLPLMDDHLNPLPLQKANVFDWNKAVMRALTKCIAFNSGYGLSVYADDFSDLSDKSGKKVPAKSKSAPAKTSPAPESTKTDSSSADAPNTESSDAPPPAPVEVKSIAERFRSVMLNRYRKGKLSGLLSLFNAIKSSTKYTPEEKPECYSLLVSAIGSVIKENPINMDIGMFKTFLEHNALSYVPAEFKEAVIDVYLTALLSHVDALAAENPEDMLSIELVDTLVQAGFIQSMVDLEKKAIEQGLLLNYFEAQN